MTGPRVVGCLRVLLVLLSCLGACKEPLDVVGEAPVAALPAATAPPAGDARDAVAATEPTPEPAPAAPVDSSPPATEAECRASFDGLVRVSIAGTRGRWQRLGRDWTAEAGAEIEATMRDTEVSHIARCLRTMTQDHAACQSAARSVASWHLCTARSERQR